MWDNMEVDKILRKIMEVSKWLDQDSQDRQRGLINNNPWAWAEADQHLTSQEYLLNLLHQDANQDHQ